MQETWKRFVYPLIEDKQLDVEEDTYHRHIENQLMLLGWEPWKGGLENFQEDDGVPITLKAFLLNRYEHWAEDDGFKEWYQKNY